MTQRQNLSLKGETTLQEKKKILVTKSFLTLACNSLPDDKILDLFKFIAFADNKIILTQNLKFVSGRVEKIVGKGENAVYQHFHLFPQCFQNLSFSRGVKSRDCVVKGQSTKLFTKP